MDTLRAARVRSRRHVVIVLVFGTLGTAVWVGVAAAMAPRGFGGANEGYYLLSYEHWDTDARTFSMAQYFYGPVFEVLHHNVVLLRLFRLATALVAHGFFGWQFMTWLARIRPRAVDTRLWRFAGLSVILASGGVVYGWLPATPGYNDIQILGAMTLLACHFRLLTTQSNAARTAGTAVAFGVVSTVMVAAKVTMLLCVLVIAAAVVAAAGSRRDRTRLAVFSVVGMALVAGWLELLRPLGQTLPPMLSTLHVVSGSAHRPTDLLGTYVVSISQTLGLAAAVFVVPAVALVAVLRRGSGTFAHVAPVAGVATSVILVALTGGLHGGLRHVGAYQAGVVGMLLIVGVAAVAATPDRAGAGQIVLVASTPVLAAIGTNNPIVAVAIGGAAMWVAVMVYVSTGFGSDTLWAHQMSRAATAGAVLICVCVGVSGATYAPTGASLLTSGRRIVGVPLLSSLRVQEPSATRLISLRARLNTYITPPGRPMLAFGELADYVLVLNGTPVGNAWFSAGEDGLQAADLRAACVHGNPWGARQPLILARRALTRGELGGFEACGLDVRRDYTGVRLDDIGLTFWVLVPNAGVQSVTTGAS